MNATSTVVKQKSGAYDDDNETKPTTALPVRKERGKKYEQRNYAKRIKTSKAEVTASKWFL